MMSRTAAIATPVALVGLSVSGHVLGGGASPSAVAVTFVSMAAGLLGSVLTVLPRRPSTAGLAAVFAAFQIAAHGILHTVAGSGPVPLDAISTHHHAGAALVATAAHGHELSTLAATHAHAPVLSLLMPASHLAMTLMLAWLLGPALTFARAAMDLLVAIVFGPTPVSAPRPLLGSCLARLTASRDVGLHMTLRGPPVAFA